VAKDEIEFVDGLIVKAPHPNAPDFVKAQISIKVEDLGKWLREKYKAGNEWVNIDVKESKGGKWYAAVSTFKPKAKPEEKKPAGRHDDLEDDIPFAPIGKLEASAR
jgi:hypothetical protein